MNGGWASIVRSFFSDPIFFRREKMVQEKNQLKVDSNELKVN